jgi:hypothetical protein
MTARIGFTCGVGMQVYPRIDTEGFALFEQELFAIVEIYRAD